MWEGVGPPHLFIEWSHVVLPRANPTIASTLHFGKVFPPNITTIKVINIGNIRIYGG